MNNKIKLQIILPFLLIIAVLIISRFVSFQPSFSANEMKLINFTPEKINLSERQGYAISENFKSPIEAMKIPDKSFPTVPLSQIAPQKGDTTVEPFEIKVSMIVINEKRLAIVNGIVIREGDSIGSLKVLKIEKDRILLKDIHQKVGNRWAYLGEAK